MRVPGGTIPDRPAPPPRFVTAQRLAQHGRRVAVARRARRPTSGRSRRGWSEVIAAAGAGAGGGLDLEEARRERVGRQAARRPSAASARRDRRRRALAAPGVARAAARARARRAARRRPRPGVPQSGQTSATATGSEDEREDQRRATATATIARAPRPPGSPRAPCRRQTARLARAPATPGEHDQRPPGRRLHEVAREADGGEDRGQRAAEHERLDPVRLAAPQRIASSPSQRPGEHVPRRQDAGVVTAAAARVGATSRPRGRRPRRGRRRPARPGPARRAASASRWASVQLGGRRDLGRPGAQHAARHAGQAP